MGERGRLDSMKPPPAKPKAKEKTTEDFDNFKKEKLLKDAEAAARVDPDAGEVGEALDVARDVYRAYGIYRATLKGLTAKGTPDAKGREKALRMLKSEVDAAVAARAPDTGELIQKLVSACSRTNAEFGLG